MRLFDYNETSLLQSVNPSAKVAGIYAQGKMAADLKKSSILRQVEKLSIDPVNTVLGFSYEPESEDFYKDLKCFANGEPASHRIKLHEEFPSIYYQHMQKHEVGFDFMYSFPQELDALPPIPAIYFCCRELGGFFERREIWYIGKTNNLRARWKDHHKHQALKAIGANLLYCQPMNGISDLDISVLERLYLMMFSPHFNDTSIKGFESEDLKSAEYRQGFNDGVEKSTEDAIACFGKEIARLHLQILNLQGGKS